MFFDHMIWNFRLASLAFQGHILCHDCSNFKIHIKFSIDWRQDKRWN